MPAVFKGVAVACAQTSFVEDDRDFIGGVAVQQAVDFLDDLGAEFVELVDAGRPRNGKNCGGAALEADAEGNVLLLGQSDVFQ